MKNLSEFKYFLENTVNLNQSRIDDLDSRVTAITTYLDGQFATDFVEVIPQGSYAHRTIIKPVKGRDFDADVLFQIVEQPDWEPKDYIGRVWDAFRRSGTYHDLVDRKTRCVTVDYADDFHIDVVPFVERTGSHYVTNRHENRFELTNPEGFNEWLDIQNRIASNHLVEVIRLLKYLRDSKGTFSIKSVILTALLGGVINNANVWNDTDYYGDMATALYHVCEDLDAYLQANSVPPWIADPSCPSENLNHRWDQPGYANFRDRIHHYTGKIRAAYAESDKDTSISAWQEVFSSNFQTPPQTVVASASRSLVPATEQWLKPDFGISTIATHYTLRIKGRSSKLNGWRHGPLSSRGNRVEKGRDIVFDVQSCDVPKPYDVYWKVRNTGAEAENAHQLRGEITRDKGFERRKESTAYRGSHYVECFVVKDGVCVASDKQLVFVV